MNIDKAIVKEITRTFGIKAVIELRDGFFQKQNLAFRLKEVKEMCMRLVGRRPLDWKGN